MNRIRLSLSAICLATGLAACGGGGDGNQSPAVQYSAVVSFGDSLSDVGTYGVGALNSVYGGGKYTVNGPNGKNWTEFLSTQLGVAAPCAAQTGLNSSGPSAGFYTATTNHTGCYNYAQGGARVTNPIGPANADLTSTDAAKAYDAAEQAQGTLGQLTVPVVTQIQNHLAAVGGSFSGNELVTVMAGGNDIFRQLANVSYRGRPTSEAVANMATAGAELAAYVRTAIVANGARRVVVINLVDVSKSPFAYSQSASTQTFINLMVSAFNAQLASGLATTSGVLLVDAYTASRDQAANPSQYGLTNATTPACDLNAASNPLHSSLTCTESNTLASTDVSKYLFADDVHPTPYGYRLLAQLVAQKMAARGWL